MGDSTGGSVVCRDFAFRAGTHNGEQLKMLSSITTLIRSKELCAVIGPSGAGKSTLFNILSGRASGGIRHGDMCVLDNRSLPTRCGYVMQDDALFEVLTPQETLQFAARLRMTASEAQRLERINWVLDVLNLQRCKLTKVGSEQNAGLSGGEKKRLSIAIELLVVPDVLFLDEPTTGLDSETALEVVAACRAIADLGHVVVATIHQPSSEAFELFDKVLVLSAGESIYFGSPFEVVRLLEENLEYPRGDKKNNADYVLAAADEIAKSLQKAYVSSSQHQQLLEEISKIGFSEASTSAVVDPLCVPQSTVLSTLVARFSLVSSRERITKVILLRVVALALLVGLLFWDYKQTVEGAQLLFGGCFTVVFMHANLYCNAMAQLYEYRNAVEREIASSLYTPVLYQIAFTLTQLPMLGFQSILFSCIVYPMYGLDWEFGRFVYFMLTCALTMYISLVVTMVLSCSTRNMTLAFAQVPQFQVIYSVFAGLVVLPSEMWIGLRWIADIMFSRWAISGLVINEVDGKDTWCYESDPSTCLTEEELLDHFDCNNWDRWYSVYVSLAWLAAGNIVVTYFLYTSKDKRLDYSTVDLSQKSSDEKNKPRPRVASIFSTVKSKVSKRRKGDDVHGTMELTEETPLVGTPSKGEKGLAEAYGVGAATVTDSSIGVGGLEVLFRDIRSSNIIEESGETKELLHGISGLVRRGEMCAVMGPSGAGKTTLLHVLAGRKSLPADGNGRVFVNGRSVVTMSEEELDSLNALRAYVPQDDVHLAELTVEETLKYAAVFRLSPSHGRTLKQRSARVEEVMAVLNLSAVRHIPVSRLSGGETRRLSIGVEVVAFPPLIFLDEPTSGLDASMALDVVLSLRSLCDHGKTVITTIHQPSEAAYLNFDKLLLLAGGETLYFGPASAVFDFLKSPQLKIVPGQTTNPVDSLLTAAQGNAVSETGPQVPVEKIARVFVESQWCVQLQREMQKCEEGYARGGGTNPLPPADTHRLSPRDRIFALVQRDWLEFHRGGFLRIMAYKHCFTGLLFGMLFYDLGDDYDASEARAGCIFVVVLFSFLTNMQTIPRVLNARAMLYREEAAGGYTRLMYVASVLLATFPVQCVQSALVSLLIWSLSDLRDGAGHFLYFLLVVFLAEVCGCIMCVLIGTACRTHQIAFTVFLLPTTFLSLLSGFSPRVDSAPRAWRPFFTVNPSYWALKGAFRNEFENTGTWYDDDTGKYWTDEEIMEIWGADDWEKMNSIVILLAFIALFVAGTVMVVHKVDYSGRYS